jgi:hypothetical protein
VTRADDDRPTVLALREIAETLTQGAYLGLRKQSTWVPPQDPHRETITALTDA